ncbi:uncharacterized protein LOC126315298 [Schistocerca gregaria]|uniref:uncharacterized protein LOC126315298 n=1 Tax=Schistocerca gregaria TaxID=7010 RepID=UPI00211DCD7A|nr:uncharacterized protein LOC126315298 [Schistocerca gregaria]
MSKLKLSTDEDFDTAKKNVISTKLIFLLILVVSILFGFYKLGQRNQLNIEKSIANSIQIVEPSGTGLDIFVYSWKPRIIYVRQFLSKSQIQKLISLGSSLSSKEGKEFSKVLERTKFIEEIDEKIALYARIDPNLGEDPIILRSNKGSSTDETRDWFVEDDPVLGKRILTFVIFLSNVEGGEITIPKKFINISPVAGNAVIFHHTYLTGEIDDNMIWSGKPVLSGTRWLYIKHMRSGVDSA